MLQNDATQTGSTPDARNDVDLLNQCDLGPGTGNTITGQGTVSGAAGADVTGGAAATIVALEGASGSDTGTDGSFTVEGRYGTLTMEADGSYSYTRNAGSPDGVSDVFTYTLAGEGGARDTATLTVNIRCEEQEEQPEEAQNLVTSPDGVVMLPAGVELSDIRVVGRDLVITMPDGSEMVIPGGAVFVPQLVIGDVEVPPANLAALLIESEPQPAAGTPQSSGGNFAVDVGPLDPGVPLGDLIPPTELEFTPPEFDEPTQVFEPDPPTVIIETPDNPAGSANATDSVNEAGLPARDGEPAGSDSGSDSEITSGTIVYTTPDGFESVTVNGVPVEVGTVIVTEFGRLTITAIDNGSDGAISYTYELLDNTSGNNTADVFTITVTDSDGDTATATLTVNIIDDVPTAVADTDSVAAGDFGPVTGNVITDDSDGDEGDNDDGADTVGADDAELTEVTGAGETTVGENGEFIVEGEFGTLTIGADGSYSYVRAPGTPGGVTDTFTYTLTDGDGDTSTATLTIDIGDRAPSLATPDAIQLDDDVLAGGNPGGEGDDADSVLPVEGQLEASGGDGDLDFFFSAEQEGLPEGFTANQVDDSTLQILQGDTVVLTITLDNETGEYSVVQNAPAVHPEGGDENNIPNITIGFVAEDADGDRSEPVNLTIDIDDDTPVVTRTPASAPTLLVDETDLAADASGDFSSLFSVDFGADGEGSTEFAVSVVDGTDSGLVDVATGEPILLFDNNGTIEGRVGGEGGAVAFTVSVSDAGVVTLDQVRALDHQDATDNDDPVSPDAGSIQLTVTATDSDGDPVSETIDIGGNLVFEDDGPSITDAVATGGVTLDETDAGSTGGFPISATSAGAVITATTAFGADGAGTTSFGLALQGGAGSVASGLMTAVGDNPITLYQVDSNTIEGRFGAGDTEVAFTIEMNADGTVTVTQEVPLEHLVDGSSDAAHDDPLDLDNLVEATVTVTDRDGDTATDSAAIGDAIVFEDDGPTIDVTADADAGVVLQTQDSDTIGGASDSDSSSADFSGVFDAIFDGGADGAAGTPILSFTLGVQSQGVDSGLSQAGQPIFLYVIGGEVVGSTSATDAGVSAGNIVFDVSVDADGVVTLTQHSQIDHPVTDDVVSLADGLVTLTGSSTVTDNDGDTASDSATVNIGANLQFADDGPGVDVSLTGTQIRIDETDAEVAAGGETDPAGGSLGTVTVAAGALFDVTVDPSADAPTTLGFALTLSSQGVNSGLLQSATNQPIFLYNIGGVVIGSTSATEAGVSDGNTVFTVSIDADGDVTVTQFQAVEHGDTGSADEDSSGLATGALNVTVTATDSDGDTDSDSVDLGSVIRFEDDGPSIDVTATGEAGVTLQTDDADTIGGASDSDSSSADFSGVFDFSFDGGSDGAANTPDIDYTLGVQAQGVNSGLTQGGAPIFLYLINGEVVGSTSATQAGVTAGNTVFDVSVDANGVVSLTQHSQIDHPTADDPTATDAPFADQIASLADELITLTGTASVTDNDGDTDTDSATVNIGGNLEFTDDGPVARNDSDSVAEGASTGGNVLTGADTTSGAAGADSAGADGFAAAPEGAVIGITSVNQGTSDTAADGSGDFELQGEWGTLTLNRDGSYTYTADPNSNPTGPDVFTYTVVDADGDTSTATLTINVGDITLRPDNDTQTVNEAALDTAITGDDVAAGSVTGSNPGSTAETVMGALNVTGATSFTLDSPAVGSFGTLELNADGTYTYTLTQPVDSTPDADDGTNTELGAEVFTYTATDANGNSVQGTITINIIDDVPSVDVTADGEAGTVVETQDADTIGNASDTDSSSADFSGVFDLTFVEGADGATVTPDIGYTLGVQSQGVNSGLTQGGQPIFLYSIGGAVVGSTSATEAGVLPGNTVFDVTVDASGVVTLTQHSQLDHPIADDLTATEAPFADQIVSLADDLITLTGTATITDNDGDVDTDSATVNIGSNLQFADDGPNAFNDTVNQATENADVVVDVFANDSAGADGVDLATGVAVVPGSLSGSGQLTYNGDGTFTYNPANNEAGPITFDYEITDADGDTDTATLTINLRPDSNPQPVNAAASVDDEGLANGLAGGDGDLVVSPDPDTNEATFSGTLSANFGGDAPGTFSLAAMDGETATIGTETVEYSWVGNTLTATITSGDRADTPLFQVTVNPTSGAYTVTLLNNVLHANDGTNTENDATAALTFTATDSELESATGTLTITFDDDTPVAFTTEGTDVANQAGGTGGGSLDLGDGNINNNVGADSGTVQFHPDLDGADSGLESGMQPIIYSLSEDGQTLTATAGGNTVFVVTIDQATSSYSIEMFGEIDSFTQIDFNDGSRNFVGGNEPWAGFNTLANDNSADLLLTPIVDGVSQTTTNTNANSGGVDDNFVDLGEAYRLDFVTDLRGDNSGSDYEDPGNADHVFDGHYTTNGASALIVSTDGAVVRVEAFDDPDGNNAVGDGAHDDVTGVAISYNGAQSTIITSSGNVTVGGRTFTVTFNGDGTVDIGNLEGGSGPNPGGTRIAVFTDDGYNSLTFTNVGGDDFRIGDFGAAVRSTDPVPFELPVVIVDGDGDMVEGTDIQINAVTPASLTGSSSASMLANDSVEQQMKTMNAANTNAVFLGAIATAGLSGAPAAASVADFQPLDLVDTADLPAFSTLPAARGLETDIRSMLLDEAAAPVVEADGRATSASSPGGSDPATSSLSQADMDAPAEVVSQLAQGTDAPAQAQVADVLPVADAIAMPSAEALRAALGGDADAQAPAGEVEGALGRVLADALAGGHDGPNIDAVLDGIAAGHSGAEAAAQAIASHLAADVSAWDMGAFSHFQGAHSAYTMEAIMAQVDSPQATSV